MLAGLEGNTAVWMDIGILGIASSLPRALARRPPSTHPSPLRLRGWLCGRGCG